MKRSWLTCVVALGVPVALLLPGSTSALGSLVPIGADGYVNANSQHAAQVEPDSFAYGSTVIAAAQTGRYFNGGSSNINVSVSNDSGVTWARRRSSRGSLTRTCPPPVRGIG